MKKVALKDMAEGEVNEWFSEDFNVFFQIIMNNFEKESIASDGAKSGNYGNDERRVALAEDEKGANGDWGGENRGEQETTNKGTYKQSSSAS